MKATDSNKSHAKEMLLIFNLVEKALRSFVAKTEHSARSHECL